MKKLTVMVVAIFATTFCLSAQKQESSKEEQKKETKVKRKTKSYNYENWGGESIRGEGPSVTETRDIRDFKGVKSSISSDVILKQTSGEYKVTLEGQKNIISHVKMEVIDGSLKISFEKGYSLSYTEPLKIAIEAPSFESLGMSGSGNVSAEGRLSGKNLDIKLSGSGNFNFDNLQYEALNVGISGSGNINLGGTVDTTNLGISGSGNLKADNLKVEKAHCHVSGSGGITLNVSKELDAAISGSGNIRYVGNPSSVKSHISGSGAISSR